MQISCHWKYLLIISFKATTCIKFRNWNHKSIIFHLKIVSIHLYGLGNRENGIIPTACNENKEGYCSVRNKLSDVCRIPRES